MEMAAVQIDELDFSGLGETLVTDPQDGQHLLVPDEGFAEEMKPDNSKAFTCKQCGKEFKRERSVKQHIAAAHKSLKRTAEKSLNSVRKTQKRSSSNTDSHNDTVAFCRSVVDKDSIRRTFSLDVSVEKLLMEENVLHSTAIADPDEELISPDQDHNYFNVNSDTDLLKAKILSLELEGKRKDVLLNDAENELSMARVDVVELKEKVHAVSKEKDEKNEALESALGQNHLLKEEIVKLQDKVMLYSAAIKKLRGDRNPSDENAEIKELRKVIKEKNKKISEAESRSKLLGQRVAELESSKNDDALDDKYKKLNDRLTAKSKELKKIEANLKKSESRVKELLERNSEKGKKIFELENVNTRLKVLKDQAQEIEEKTKHHRRIHDEVSTKKSDTKINWKKDEKKKCKFEHSGTCRRKNSCGDYHPKTTCQSYSKLGSCPLESRCEHRHPYGVCYEWEQHGTCRHGDGCRHRHPFGAVLLTPRAPFLGQGSPGQEGGQREQDRRGYHSPGQGYHDLRGNRW